MPGWPVQEEMEQWLSGQSITTTTYVDRLPFAFEAALEVVQDEVWADFMPTAPTPPAVQDVPNRVRLAVFILAHRLLTRADSPSGVIGFAEFAIRVSKEDPDYQILMRKHVAPPFAALTAAQIAARA